MATQVHAGQLIQQAARIVGGRILAVRVRLVAGGRGGRSSGGTVGLRLLNWRSISAIALRAPARCRSRTSASACLRAKTCSAGSCPSAPWRSRPRSCAPWDRAAPPACCGIALTRHNRPDDRHARHAGDIRQHLRQLHVHLLQAPSACAGYAPPDARSDSARWRR